MNEYFAHVEIYHRDRLAFLKDERERIKSQAFGETSIEDFWQNKGKVNILNTLINIEESLVVRDSDITEASV